MDIWSSGGGIAFAFRASLADRWASSTLRLGRLDLLLRWRLGALTGPWPPDFRSLAAAVGRHRPRIRRTQAPGGTSHEQPPPTLRRRA